jgi:hypothetical protein
VQEESTPIIRPQGTLNSSEATLAPRLVQALSCQEIHPVTEIGTAATGFLYQLDVEKRFPGRVLSSEHADKVFWI